MLLHDQLTKKVILEIWLISSQSVVNSIQFTDCPMGMLAKAFCCEITTNKLKQFGSWKALQTLIALLRICYV